MNFTEAIDYIENTGKFGINLGLSRIEKLCELMGNPEKDLKVIHVAGTNGKGSTSTFIASILGSQGYRVGIYTSPYIERFTERIKVNDDEIKEEEVVQLIEEIMPYIDILVNEGYEHPTEFEIITACAFKYFKNKGTDFVVLEVGLGGRYDATNVVDPLLSVITTISYDHMNILGDTLGKIAFEKAGIIKEKRPVVIYPQEKVAMDVIMNRAQEKNAPVYLVENNKYEMTDNALEGIKFNVCGNVSFDNLVISLLGEHQVKNAITALSAVDCLKKLGYSIGDEAIYNGLKNAKWPGRFEIISRDPYIILDGGHNIQGIESIVKAAGTYFKGRKIKVVTGMLRDKEYKNMVEELAKISDFFITVEPDNPRALTSEELKVEIESLGKKAIASQSIRDAVDKGLEYTLKEEVLLFCGSLYMIGRARTLLKEKKL